MLPYLNAAAVLSDVCVQAQTQDTDSPKVPATSYRQATEHHIHAYHSSLVVWGLRSPAWLVLWLRSPSPRPRTPRQRSISATEHNPFGQKPVSASSQQNTQTPRMHVTGAHIITFATSRMAWGLSCSAASTLLLLCLVLVLSLAQAFLPAIPKNPATIRLFSSPDTITSPFESGVSVSVLLWCS